VGTGLTFAVPFGILGFVSAAIRGDAVLGTALLAIAILNRVVQCWAVGWGVVRDERARKLTWLYPLRDLLGFGFWAASFVGGRRTKWRGDSYIIREEGRMERVGGERVARRTTA
jgi:ceramide glucosyltransferase